MKRALMMILVPLLMQAGFAQQERQTADGQIPDYTFNDEASVLHNHCAIRCVL